MLTDDEKKMIHECYDCIHQRSVSGDAHIACADPDQQMTGEPHGVRHGWFYYPFLFDPVWKTRLCSNFKSKSIAVSDAISGAVSGQTNAQNVQSQ